MSVQQKQCITTNYTEYIEATDTTHPPTKPTHTFIKTFGYALAGIGYLFRTQRNARIHALVGACAIALGAILPLARWEWLALVIISTMVITAEGVNTAIEATVDIVTSTYHPLARIAKDVAAGAVLLCAMSSVIIGCIIFIPHLLPIIQAVMSSL